MKASALFLFACACAPPSGRETSAVADARADASADAIVEAAARDVAIEAAPAPVCADGRSWFLIFEGTQTGRTVDTIRPPDVRSVNAGWLTEIEPYLPPDATLTELRRVGEKAQSGDAWDRAPDMTWHWVTTYHVRFEANELGTGMSCHTSVTSVLAGEVVLYRGLLERAELKGAVTYTSASANPACDRGSRAIELRARRSCT